MKLRELAKEEISQAWGKVRITENAGLDFGKTCYEWGLRLGEMYLLYKELGIRPTDANWWMDKYKTHVGLKDLHKEKRPNRSSFRFPEIQQTAIELLKAGFAAMRERNPSKMRLFQSARDWGHALLSRTDL
jgi:hypothetical protein